MDKFEQQSLFDDNPAYKDFTDKFKPKLTTDDCYTPPEVYDAVRDWVCAEYGIDPAGIVRPFYPGGDYERHEYPDGCTVLDNPPFSILTKICEFYLQHGIRFFLFAPGLTAFSSRNVVMRTTHIVCEAKITYANGAIVGTAFVTNLGGDVIARTAPAEGPEGGRRPGGHRLQHPGRDHRRGRAGPRHLRGQGQRPGHELRPVHGAAAGREDQKVTREEYRALLKKHHLCRECKCQDAYTYAGRTLLEAIEDWNRRADNDKS